MEAGQEDEHLCRGLIERERVKVCPLRSTALTSLFIGRHTPLCNMPADLRGLLWQS